MFFLNTDEDLNSFKDTLRILTDEDDSILRNYLKTAEVSLQTAVGKDFNGFYSKDDVRPLYRTACFALAGTLYTYRVSVTDIAQYPVNSTYNSIVGALRGMYLQAESEAENG